MTITAESVSLTTRYLGLTLRNPLVASSSPLTGRVDTLARLDAAGVGAVVLPSLFVEQIEHDEMAMFDLAEQGRDISPEITGYLDPFTGVELGPEAYLRRLEAARAALSVPVIASLNGHRPGSWTEYATLLEQTGADAIELNLYFLATDAAESGRDIEDRTVETVAEVASRVRLPVNVKIGPWFSSLPHLLRRIADAGARGVTLFNRFYQPDVDLDYLEVAPRLVLSTSEEARLALRWIAILHGRTPLDLAASSGAHDERDVLKLLLVGADVVTMASALLHHGPEHVAQVLTRLRAWMAEHDYDRIDDLRGALSQRAAPDPAAFERANYLRTLTRYAAAYTPPPR
jgi:dihydroorotate dehydrogenase (fumarate)